MALLSKDTLRRSESPKGAMRGNIGSNSATTNTNVRTVVRSGRMDCPAGQYHRRESAVRATVNHKINLLRQQFSFTAHCRLVPGARRVPLRRSDHVFSP